MPTCSKRTRARCAGGPLSSSFHFGIEALAARLALSRLVLRPALSRFALFHWLVLWSCVLLFLSGCERCSREQPLAELVTFQGKVDRDRAKQQNQWLAATQGATFFVGDAIRTGQAAGARLHLDDGSVLGLEEETLVRFLDRAPGQEQALDVQTGEASLVASQEGLTVHTAFGLARLEAGTKINLTRNQQTLRVQVLLGSATLENSLGDVMQISEGQTVETTLGNAVMELLEEEPARIAEPPPSDLPTGPIAAQIKGASVRMQPPGSSTPVPVTAGSHTLVSGSVLVVGRGSSVHLVRGNQTAELNPGIFVVGQGDDLVQSQSGSFTVGSDDRIAIRVPGGVITTIGGRATITPEGGKGTRVDALSGTVILAGKGSQELKGGDQGHIDPDGGVSVKGRGLTDSDLDVPVGQSLVVHDPRPPTKVGFSFDGTCARGKLELTGSKAAIPGDDSAIGENKLVLQVSGRVDYTLRCLDAEGKPGPVAARGSVAVMADAGTRPVPKTAPSTTIDLNGRAYTVLYQNQLPRVTLRWSGAPAASSYLLKRSSRGSAKTYSTSSPSYTFSPGALSDGTHTFYFEGGGRISRRSTVTLGFDNATPTATLLTPANTGVAPGGELRVAGTGLPGWTVTVDGKAVAQDADGRFSVSTPMPKNGRPSAVYLSHPARGTHVYLRRPAEAK